jgi:septum formation protein
MLIVLASASPRRADLLRAAGFGFSVCPVDVDERRHDRELPADYVARLARIKASTAAVDHAGALVLAADTAVAVDEDVFGKPSDAGEAADMLRRLSGRSHLVLTGVALATVGECQVFVEQTRVWFDPLSASDVQWYVASGEPLDKAGAYAVQGLASRFIPRIEGSYSNVVGLPIAQVNARLRALGIR